MNFEQFLAAFNAAAAQQTGGQHRKAVGNTMGATLLTQPGGLFSVAGMDRVIISTHVQPMGLGAYLPAFGSALDDPRYGLITGFGAEAGTEAVYPCDDAPTGYMKAGTLTAAFGRIMRQTNTIEVDSLLNESRSSTLNLQLLNEMFNGGSTLLSGLDSRGAIRMVTQGEMITLGVNLERKLAPMVWSGTPSANTAQGGYKEFPGLDAQIATGQKDAETGVLLPSVDSLIMNFAYNLVDGVALDIVEQLSFMEFYLRNLATRTGLQPVEWAVVMRPELWFELSSIWPCRYLTDRCTNAAGTGVITINDDTSITMRDEMRNGSYITINGRRYPVVVDDGIFEHTNVNNANVPAGTYASSIYFVPLRARGNFPVTYWEYKDYRGLNSELSVLGAGGRNVPFWTDNGRLLWVYRENGYCFDLQAKIEPRIVLRTPHLAGKIQNVRYSPLQHLVSPFPDSPYWRNGGVSVRSFTTGQAVWR